MSRDVGLGSARASLQLAEWVMLLVLIVLTVGDVVLGAVLFELYTSTYAQYVNQGTALVYCFVSTSILVYRRRRADPSDVQDLDYTESPSPGGLLPGREPLLRDDQTTLENAASAAQFYTNETKSLFAPWYLKVAIGGFNGTANFCMAMGQPHTAGLTQSLIMTALGIPLVMLLSFVFLKKSSSLVAIIGAVLICGGSACSGLRAVYGPGASGQEQVVYWYSELMFAAGIIFVAGERVFEEHSFARYRSFDVMEMFCWTMWTQFILGWLLYPLQTLPALGGLHLRDIPGAILGGAACTVGITMHGDKHPTCSWFNPVIFFTYCAVDFCTYGMGLYVIRRGGANLMVLASGVALPLQQLVLCLRFLMSAKYVESFFWGDAVALVLVLLGFGVYHVLSPEGKQARQASARQQTGGPQIMG